MARLCSNRLGRFPYLGLQETNPLIRAQTIFLAWRHGRPSAEGLGSCRHCWPGVRIWCWLCYQCRVPRERALLVCRLTWALFCRERPVESNIRRTFSSPSL